MTDSGTVIPPTKRQRETAAQGTFTVVRNANLPDNALCIYRVPTGLDVANASHLAARHPVHQPAFLRSTRLTTPKPNAAIRINELLTELGISSQRLVMPTRDNVELFDGLLVAAGALVDMKRQVDRVEQEVKTLTAQRQGFVPPFERRKVRLPLLQLAQLTQFRDGLSQ
jgi:DNA methyltransferase 1-associated protein 1